MFTHIILHNYAWPNNCNLNQLSNPHTPTDLCAFWHKLFSKKKKILNAVSTSHLKCFFTLLQRCNGIRWHLNRDILRTLHTHFFTSINTTSRAKWFLVTDSTKRKCFELNSEQSTAEYSLWTLNTHVNCVSSLYVLHLTR